MNKGRLTQYLLGLFLLTIISGQSASNGNLENLFSNLDPLLTTKYVEFLDTDLGKMIGKDQSGKTCEVLMERRLRDFPQPSPEIKLLWKPGEHTYKHINLTVNPYFYLPKERSGQQELELELDWHKDVLYIKPRSNNSEFLEIQLNLRTSILSDKADLWKYMGLMQGSNDYANITKLESAGGRNAVPTLYKVILRDGRYCDFSMYSFNSSPSLQLNFGQIVPNRLYRSRLLGRWGWALLKEHLAKNSLNIPDHVFYLNIRNYVKYSVEGWKKDDAITEGLAVAEDGKTYRHPYDGLMPHTFVEGTNPERPYGSVFSQAAFHKNNFMRIYEVLTPDDKHLFNMISKNTAKEYHDEALRYADEGKKFTYEDGNTEDVLKLVSHILDLLIAGDTVLFHCIGGIHKTGLIAAIFRHCSKDSDFWTYGAGPIKDNDVQGLTPLEIEFAVHTANTPVRTSGLEILRQLFNPASEIGQKYSDQINEIEEKCHEAGI